MNRPNELAVNRPNELAVNRPNELAVNRPDELAVNRTNELAVNRTPFDERGSIGGIEGLAFGILLFAFGTLMVVNTWAVVDGKMTAGAAAREASRAYVENADTPQAIEHARAATGKYHLDDISISSSTGSYERCVLVTATVRIDVPRVSLPLIGGTGGTYPVSASYTEAIDPYRSNLTGSTQCD